MFEESLLAGILASVGSTFGKLSGTSSVVGESYVIWMALLISMVVTNTLGCRYFLRSLDAASNSVTPTVVSSATNYLLSGIIGFLLFRESASLAWWGGASLITVGLALTASPGKKMTESEKQS